MEQPRNIRQAGVTSPGASDSDGIIARNPGEQTARWSQETEITRKDEGQIELSIIIPAYNERNRLPQTLLDTVQWCQENCSGYEIIVVDDGSTDKTLEIGLFFSEYHDRICCISNPHLGKGAAVRCGMLNSSGKEVLFMDADGATPLQEIHKLRDKLKEGYAIAVGSRVAQIQGGETRVVTSLHRKLAGRFFAGIVKLCGVSGIRDTQCGFKLFRREVIGKIFPHQKLNGFAFDVEILFLAHKLSLPVSEVPVDWHNKQGSKVNLVLDGVRMLYDVLRLKVIHSGLKP